MMRGRWLAAAAALGLAASVGCGCALVPQLVSQVATPAPPQAGEPAACLTLDEVLLTRLTVVRGVDEAFAGHETAALLAASQARAELSVLVSDLHVEDGPEDLRAFVEEVAGVVAREADVLDLGRVEAPTRERLLGEGRSTLQTLDSTLRLALGEGSLAARACTREPFVIPPFEFPAGG